MSLDVKDEEEEERRDHNTNKQQSINKWDNISYFNAEKINKINKALLKFCMFYMILTTLLFYCVSNLGTSSLM